MGGGNRLTIVSLDIFLPAALTIDYTENLLYWSDLTKYEEIIIRVPWFDGFFFCRKIIERCEFDGTNRQVVLESVRAKSLEIFSNWLYYSDPLSSKSLEE